MADPIKNPDYNKAPPKGGSGISINLPPPKDKTKGTQEEQFIKWAVGKGAPKKVAADIWYWAGKSDLDPYYWASVIKAESNFKQGADSGQAKGIGQIAYSWADGTNKHPWDKNKTITLADLNNYGFNLRFSAFLLRDAVGKYGYDGAYLEGYNPKDPNKQKAWANIQSYWPKGRAFSPSAPPGEADNPGIGPTLQNTDPWVTGVAKGGKLSLSSAILAPGGSLKWDGLPVKQSDFLRLKRSLESTYVSYTGQRPSNAQVQQFIQKGWGEYTLTVLLSKSKNFVNSPLWKQNAPTFQAAGKDLTPGGKVDQEMIRKAIVNNWDTSTFQAEVRKTKGYVDSNEFKGTTATMANVYQSIYGEAGPGGMTIVKEAALGGWSPDQFAAWLRSRDEYVYTPEYRAKATSLVEQLGFLTGNVATLQKTKDAAPENTAPEAYGPLPNDPRVSGKPGIIHGPALVPGVQR